MFFERLTDFSCIIFIISYSKAGAGGLHPPTMTNSASLSSLCEEKHVDQFASEVLNKGKGFSFKNAVRSLGLLGEQSTGADAEAATSDTSLAAKSDASSFKFTLPANSRARTKSASNDVKSPRKSSGNDGDDSYVSNDEDDGIYFKVTCWNGLPLIKIFLLHVLLVVNHLS